MLRAGVSLPALMRLMGHAHIHTTLLYIQLTPQDVFDEYARAVGGDRAFGPTWIGMRPPSHPLEQALQARVRLLATTLRPATVQHYRHTAGLFLSLLRERFPEVRRPVQIRRDPHVLAWLEQLWTRGVPHSGKPLSNTTRAGHLIRLRKLFDLLADHAFPPRPGLVWSEDLPRPDHVLPRPLQPEDDARLQTELRSRNDLLSNALLLTRLTGMRIGECVDLAPDCLRHLGDNRWAIHVPLGKLHTERWVPVDEEVRAILARLAFLRTWPPAAEQFLLPRPKSRSMLFQDLRAALASAADRAGIASKIVPHQLRHTYATSMLRAGVSLPALMQLLGHRTANMTLRYVEITQQDLQREFLQARAKPRHLVPMPAALDRVEPQSPDAASVVEKTKRRHSRPGFVR
jgi:site-specific recombinase XerD